MHIKLYEEWSALLESNKSTRLNSFIKFLDQVGYTYNKSTLLPKMDMFHREYLKINDPIRLKMSKYLPQSIRLNDFGFSINIFPCLSGLLHINLPNHSYTNEDRPDHFDIPRDLALYALRFLLYGGFTLEGASALVANLWVESFLNTHQKQIKGGPGRGLAQWTKSERWDIFLNNFLPKFKRQNKQISNFNWYDIEAQLSYIIHELKNGAYDEVDRELRTSGNLHKKAIMVLQKYEVAGTRNDKTQHVLRSQIADLIYNIAKSDPMIGYIMTEVDMINKLDKILYA